MNIFRILSGLHEYEYIHYSLCFNLTSQHSYISIQRVVVIVLWADCCRLHHLLTFDNNENIIAALDECTVVVKNVNNSTLDEGLNRDLFLWDTKYQNYY